MSTGVIFSTGGNDAQGDRTGADAAGFATSVGLSEGVFKTSPPDLGCAAERGFNTVAFGPTVVVGFCCADNLALCSSACRSFAINAAACSSARMAAESFCDRVILVPSFHSIVSGAQSSSSSSISAHLDSLPSPSACSRVARCMPYCCLSSSSVKCFCAGWGAARNCMSSGASASFSEHVLPLFLFQTCIGSGPDAPCLVPKWEDLGADTLFALAVLATSRGRGAGGSILPAVAVTVGLIVNFDHLDPCRIVLPLSPLVLAADGVGVPAFARKFFVTDTALNVAGFLTELERAWCLASDSSLPVPSD